MKASQTKRTEVSKTQTYLKGESKMKKTTLITLLIITLLLIVSQVSHAQKPNYYCQLYPYRCYPDLRVSILSVEPTCDEETLYIGKGDAYTKRYGYSVEVIWEVRNIGGKRGTYGVLLGSKAYVDGYNDNSGSNYLNVPEPGVPRWFSSITSVWDENFATNANVTAEVFVLRDYYGQFRDWNYANNEDSELIGSVEECFNYPSDCSNQYPPGMPGCPEPLPTPGDYCVYQFDENTETDGRYDCDSICRNQADLSGPYTWLGNDVCDSSPPLNLNCEAFNYDGGDCS